MNKRLLMLTCAFGAISSLAGHAAAAPAAATAAADQGVAEVVVTAEKREQSLQHVPVAISAFTSKERDIKGIETIQDITNFTPGLTYSTQLDRTNMRGLGRLTNQLSADSAVAVYSDDFFTTSTTEAGRDTLFVDRVEVLRGPQGTLYGRNAIGGVINIISKRPTAVPYAEARATFGNYGYANYEGVVSGPLADGLNFRLGGYYLDQEKGYFSNVAGGPTEGSARKEYYVEGQFSAKLGDNAEWWVKAFTQGWTDRGGPGALLGTPTTGAYDTNLVDPGPSLAFPGGTGTQFAVTFNPNFGYNTTFAAAACGLPEPGKVCGTGGPVPGSVVGAVNGGINPADQNIHHFAHDQVLGVKLTDTYAINSHFVYHFPGVDFKYITGYDTYHYALTSDWDNSSVSSYKLPLNPAGACALGAFGPTCTNATVFPAEKFGYDEYNHWFSHEFNLTSTDNGPVQWTAGAYYFDETYTNPITVGLKQQPEVYSPYNAGLSAFGSAPNPSGNFYNTSYTMSTKSAALYGQADWKMTDTVKLTGGLRYTSDHKSGNEYYRLISFNQTALLENFGTFASSPFVVPSTAFDITPVVISHNSTDKGVCSAATQLTNGVWTRCLKDSSSAVTGTAGIEWSPDHSTLAYARYSKGYKAFGFNAGTIAPQPESAPEHVDDYEIGLKKSFGRTLTLDMALFYYNYSNAQVPVGVNNGGITLTQFFNASRAHSDGFEFEGNWSPVSHLNLALTYSYNDTAIDSTCNASGSIAPGVFPANCFPDANDPNALAPGAQPKAVEAASGQVLQSVKGNALPQAPRNKVAFNANYTFEFDPGDLTVSGSYIWKDKSYAGIFERSYDEAPSWSQVDFRATWAGKNDKYEIIGFLKNAFDSRGYEAAATGIPNGTNTTFANNSYSLAAPRLYGIEFHYKFF
jgi:iron complex outermembrane receptor protein